MPAVCDAETSYVVRSFQPCLQHLVLYTRRKRQCVQSFTVLQLQRRKGRDSEAENDSSERDGTVNTTLQRVNLADAKKKYEHAEKSTARLY
jgi:hypothetical protein